MVCIAIRARHRQKACNRQQTCHATDDPKPQPGGTHLTHPPHRGVWLQLHFAPIHPEQTPTALCYPLADLVATSPRCPCCVIAGCWDGTVQRWSWVEGGGGEGRLVMEREERQAHSSAVNGVASLHSSGPAFGGGLSGVPPRGVGWAVVTVSDDGGVTVWGV